MIPKGTGPCLKTAAVAAFLRFRGRILPKKSLSEALTIAADFTAECMDITLKNPDHVNYAVEFERAIPYLVRRLYGDAALRSAPCTR